MKPKVEWLKERQKGIGGSDVAAICGVSPYRTPLQVWEDKRGMLQPQEDNDAMFWGRTLEPVVRQRYTDVTGRPVRIPEGILKHPSIEYMLANIDGFTDDGRLVEIKTTAYPTDWGEPGTDEIPLGYMLQVQHYMIITAFPVADVPVLIGGRDFRIYEVPEDKELQAMLMEKEADFWQMVLSGTPPVPINYQDVIRLYRKSEAKTVTATEGIEHLIVGLKSLRENIKLLEGNEEEVKRQIMEFMAEADTLIDLKGNTLATWRTEKEVKRFDVRNFENAMPEMFKQFLITGEAQRRFLLKGGKTNGK